MSKTANFKNSSEAIVRWAENLIALSEHNGFGAKSSSLLDIMTICRQTNVDLPELECYAKSRERRPTLLLCGGDFDFARRIASCFGYTLHESEAAGVELLTLEQQKGVQSDWRFLWSNDPEKLEPLLNNLAGFEILIEQKACVFVTGETVSPLLQTLRDTGQKLWEIPSAECYNPEYLKVFFSEINTLIVESKDQVALRESAQWSWIKLKLTEKIDKQKLHYQTMLDKLGHKNKLAKYMLDEFRTNWVNGARNHIDAYINNRTNSPAFAQFLDLKEQGPVIQTYMSALSMAQLRSKLETHMTHRMAEFVAGLDALAVKVELRQIAIGGIYSPFSFEKIPDKIEKFLKDKSVFPEGGSKKISTFKALTGKSQTVLDERKGQIAKANRLIAQMIENEFVEWCKGLMIAVEAQIKLQLAGVLANQGLPDAEGLQNRLNGLDQVAKALNGESQSEKRSAESSVHVWIDVLAQQQLIPRYAIQ